MPRRTQSQMNWLAARLESDAEVCDAEAQTESPREAGVARRAAAILRADAALLRGGVTPNRYQT